MPSCDREACLGLGPRSPSAWGPLKTAGSCRRPGSSLALGSGRRRGGFRTQRPDVGCLEGSWWSVCGGPKTQCDPHTECVSIQPVWAARSTCPVPTTGAEPSRWWQGQRADGSGLCTSSPLEPRWGSSSHTWGHVGLAGLIQSACH